VPHWNSQKVSSPLGLIVPVTSADVLVTEAAAPVTAAGDAASPTPAPTIITAAPQAMAAAKVR